MEKELKSKEKRPSGNKQRRQNRNYTKNGIEEKVKLEEKKIEKKEKKFCDKEG